MTLLLCIVLFFLASLVFVGKGSVQGKISILVYRSLVIPGHLAYDDQS